MKAHDEHLALDKLNRENKKLREVLEFYASERNYRQSEEEYFEGYPPEIMNDTGYKARKTLEEIK